MRWWTRAARLSENRLAESRDLAGGYVCGTDGWCAIAATGPGTLAGMVAVSRDP